MNLTVVHMPTSTLQLIAQRRLIIVLTNKLTVYIALAIVLTIIIILQLDIAQKLTQRC